MNKCSHHLSVLAAEKLLSRTAERKTFKNAFVSTEMIDWKKNMTCDCQLLDSLDLKESQEVKLSISPAHAANTRGKVPPSLDPQGCFNGS